jgi:FAD/FMN-containing dehydrogenase
MTSTRPIVSGLSLDEETVRSLSTSIRGTVLRPGDSGYDAACEVWNGMISRRPAFIVRCTTTDDVVAAVNFARDNNLLVAVRGGGHSAAGKAVCDDGLVIDMTAMRNVEVDAGNRRARVDGGATWADVDRATAMHDLATPGGLISTTGVGGLTLGGGLGWLMRSYGMACDNMVGATVVTASGEVVHTSESERPELLWGLRGGGGNFGVVTSFEFNLYPVSTVTAGMLVHPYDRARDVLRFYREFAANAPNSLTTFCGMMFTPDGDKIIALVVCFNGSLEEAESVLGPVRSFGPPLADTIEEVRYVDFQSSMDEGFPPGMQVYWRSDFLDDLSDDAIDAMIAHFDNVTSPLSVVMLEQFGGAVKDVPAGATAFPHRSSDYNLAIISRWEDPTEADTHIGWTRKLHDAITPFASGVYVNYLSDEGEDRIRAAYGTATYDRLADLKMRYDPDNLFQLNQNIKPARATV